MDDNCCYRAISLQLYSKEKYYKNIRYNTFKYLNKTKNNYKDFYFEDFGKIITGMIDVSQLFLNSKTIIRKKINKLKNINNILIEIK